MKLSELAKLSSPLKTNPKAARLLSQNIQLQAHVIWLKAFLDFDSLTQAQAAKLLVVHRGTISRAIAKGKLDSNGKSGRKCRVSGKALLEYYQRQDAASLSQIARKDEN